MQNTSWKLETLRSRSEYLLYHSRLAKAFSEDCENLLRKFARNESFSFAKFAQTWRSMNFSLVFSNREDVIEEVTMFQEACFFIVKKYLAFSADIYIQVGAFYLLYGLYYKQAVATPVRIRLTNEEYHNLNILVIRMDAWKEFIFIYNKLKFDEAFAYVATIRPWGLDLRFIWLERILRNNIFNHTEYPDLLNSILNSNNFYGLKCLKSVNNEYEEGLREYLKDKPSVRMTFTKSTTIEDLKNTYKMSIENIISSNSSTSGQEKQEDSIYNRRQQIKRKAIKSQNNEVVEIT